MGLNCDPLDASHLSATNTEHLEGRNHVKTMSEDKVENKNAMVELETKRLRLRGAIQGDAEYLNETFADSEAMRYW